MKKYIVILTGVLLVLVSSCTVLKVRVISPKGKKFMLVSEYEIKAGKTQNYSKKCIFFVFGLIGVNNDTKDIMEKSSEGIIVYEENFLDIILNRLLFNMVSFRTVSVISPGY